MALESHIGKRPSLFQRLQVQHLIFEAKIAPTLIIGKELKDKPSIIFLFYNFNKSLKNSSNVDWDLAQLLGYCAMQLPHLCEIYIYYQLSTSHMGAVIA